MKARHTLGILLLCSGLLWASCASEKAVWVEVRENGGQKTTIAVTEGIARQLLETTEMNVNFSSKGNGDLVTREMLQAVMDGRERSLSATDGHGSEATVSMKQLRTPGRRGSDRLVLETYKAGRRTFRIALPEFEMEQEDQKSLESVKVDFGWKALLPFLAKTGGAIYINDQNDDTEVWVYVE